MSINKRPLTNKSEFRAICTVLSLFIVYLIVIRLTTSLQPASKESLMRIETIVRNDTLSKQEVTRTFSNHASSNTYRRKKLPTGQSPQRSSPKNKRPLESSSHHQSTNKQFTDCRPFDPNQVDIDSLISWGVHKRVASNLMKYRDAGGTFRSIEDLARIYGMDSLVLSRIKQCLQFPVREHVRLDGPASSICINGATEEELKALNGIGDVLASRIVKFREKLGGFVSVDQLAETYGLPPETFAGIREYLTINAAAQPIPVNEASIETLADHPYISFRQARAIVNYINQHGILRSADDLYSIHALEEDWITTIRPYLDLSETGAVSATRE